MLPSARYEVVKELGRGGMGVVYEGRERATGEAVALKVIETGARTERELSALGRLAHPSIVRVRDSFVDPRGRPVLVMDLVRGGTLKERLREGPLEREELLEVAQSLASALAHAHAQGVLHRDLKPENVMLDAGGQVRLTDFGLAYLANAKERLTRTGEILGTPAYMSPEQADGEGRIGPATDVYGFGATLYALMTGRPPFSGQSLLNVLRAVLTKAPRPPQELYAAADPALSKLCLRCLAKDPEDRFGSMEEVLAALEDCASSPPASGPRWGLWLALGSLLLGGVGAAFALAGNPAPTPSLTPSPAGTPNASASPTPSATPAPTPPGPDPASRAELERAWERVEGLLCSDLAAAEEALNAALELDPKAGRTWFLRGLLRRRQGEAAKALEAWDHEPRSVEALAGAAQLSLELRQLDEAEAQLALARKLSPNDLEIARLHGQAERARGRGHDAVAGWEAALEALPEDPSAIQLLEIGKLQALLNSLEAAEATFGRCLELAAGLPRVRADALSQRADARLRRRAPLALAAQDLQLAIEVDPWSSSAHYNRHRVFARQGQGEEAVEALARRAELEPWSLGAWSDLAEFHVMWGQRKGPPAGTGNVMGATVAAEKALALDPKALRPLTSMGQALVLLGQSQKALEYLERALERSPKHMAALAYAVSAHAALRQHGPAAELLRRILDLTPPQSPDRAKFEAELRKHEAALAASEAREPR